MNVPYLTRRFLYGIPLMLGVTFISFLLMVYFGPDKTYELLGKNPTAEQISEVRHALGYDRPFLLRYGDYLKQLLTLDLGLSDSNGEPGSCHRQEPYCVPRMRQSNYETCPCCHRYRIRDPR